MPAAYIKIKTFAGLGMMAGRMIQTGCIVPFKNHKAIQ